jgi:hypothetical protein
MADNELQVNKERTRVQELIESFDGTVMSELATKDQVIVLMHCVGMAVRRRIMNSGTLLRKDGSARQEMVLRGALKDFDRILRAHNPFQLVNTKKPGT